MEKIISCLVFVTNIFVSKIFITLFRFETMHINKCLLARFVYPKSCFYTNICNFKSNTLSRIRHVVGGSTSLLSCQQAWKLNVGTVIVDLFRIWKSAWLEHSILSFYINKSSLSEYDVYFETIKVLPVILNSKRKSHQCTVLLFFEIVFHCHFKYVSPREDPNFFIKSTQRGFFNRKKYFQSRKQPTKMHYCPVP